MLSNLLTIVAEAPHCEAAHLEEGEREVVVNQQILVRILIGGST